MYSGDLALYKGDEFIMIGKVQELSKYMDISEKTVMNYTLPSIMKKLKENSYHVVKLGNERKI